MLVDVLGEYPDEVGCGDVLRSAKACTKENRQFQDQLWAAHARLTAATPDLASTCSPRSVAVIYPVFPSAN